MPGIIERAAAAVRRRDGKPWISWNTPVDELDEIFGEQLALLKAGRLPAVFEPKEDRSAFDLAAMTMGSFNTIVLATVKAGAWRMDWISGLVRVLLGNVPRCSMVTLLAVKGGEACDCEVAFIEALMHELGAEQEYAGKDVNDQGRLEWSWDIKRAGTPNTTTVQIHQYQRVEDADAVYMRTDLAPVPLHTYAPHLRRVAVVSAPVTDRNGEPIAGRLNAEVGEALEKLKDRAKALGFVPDYFAYSDKEQWTRDVRAYWDDDIPDFSSLGDRDRSHSKDRRGHSRSRRR